MKKLLCCLIALVFALPVFSVQAGVPSVTTPQYTGVALRTLMLRDQPNKEANVIGQINEKSRVSIYDYTPQFLRVDKNGVQGYVLRTQVVEIEPINPDTTLPYGALVHHQVASVKTQSAVYKSHNPEDGSWCALAAGSDLSFWYIEDGFAVVPYQREIGYVPVSALQGITPVSPTVDYALPGDLLASFTSFYNTADTELNRGRMVNIDVACQYIRVVMNPGDSFSFNDVAGPYKKARGYQPAPVLIDGSTAPGYGGGTCQVSSTLYNVLLQLPKGMTIVQRRPHGPAGAKYLPHGVDAAVGNTDLNLVFRNDFPFAIRIYAFAKAGTLYIAVYKV